jgi:hypothetical protein
MSIHNYKGDPRISDRGGSSQNIMSGGKPQHSHSFNSIHLEGSIHLVRGFIGSDNLRVSEGPLPSEAGIDAYDSFDHHCPVKSHDQICGALSSAATAFSFVYDPHARNEPKVSDLPSSKSVQEWIDGITANAREKPKGINSAHFLLINKRKWNEASSSYSIRLPGTLQKFKSKTLAPNAAVVLSLSIPIYVPQGCRQ